MSHDDEEETDVKTDVETTDVKTDVQAEASPTVPLPTARPATEQGDVIEMVAVEPPPAQPVPLQAPPEDLPAETEVDDLTEEDDEEYEPGWAALWSYETYEQVARKVLRAGTEVAREGYQRHDAAVVLIALFLIAAGGIIHRVLLRPPMQVFDDHGLRFERNDHWLAPEPVLPSPPRLVDNAPPPPRRARGELPYHEVFTSALDPDVRLEVLIDARPVWSNMVTGLELERRNRYGELYTSDGGRTRSIAGHDWLRTAYRYAYAPEKGDEPRIGRAVEYATVDREQLYAVTFHGPPDEIEYLEELITPTLRIEKLTGGPLLPQNRVTQVRAPEVVREAQASTVMVAVADVVDGRLRAVGGGSGVVVSPDGSIITNYHVIHDEGGRLHDLFVIGRHVANGKPPQLVCAGHPDRSKWDLGADIAMLKCDMDLDGRAWTPGLSAGVWKPVSSPGPDEVDLGQRLWVLGYPDRGGGAITLSQGLVEGWTGEDQSLARDLIKTDASIMHGNSGGPVVDDQGHVVGIASGFRFRITSDGETIEVSKPGLVRPWRALGEAMTIARAGWTPEKGKSSFSVEPEAVEIAPEGVLISTKVVDAASSRPVPGAMLMVLRPGVSSSEVDMNRLDDQVVAWGRANADGEVHLKHPVPSPGTYTVVVVARGYQPLLGDAALQLDEETPAYWDPWGSVALEASP